MLFCVSNWVDVGSGIWEHLNVHAVFEKFGFTIPKNNYSKLVAKLVFDREALDGYKQGSNMQPHPQFIILKTWFSERKHVN